MVKTGCSGFPVARADYFRRLGAVEVVSSFVKPPRVATAEAWRAEAPEGFDFCLQAWQRITHLPSSPSYARAGALDARAAARLGHFKPTEEVARAWEAVAEVAEALRARFVLFRTPSTFYPNADHLRDMYRFFKAARRRGAAFAWEPRGGGWEGPLIRRVCGDLGLTHATAAGAEPERASVRYLRFADPSRRFRRTAEPEPAPPSPAELARRLEGRSAFVFFDSPDSWRQAQAFEGLLRPLPAQRRRPCAD